jgi:O-antigen ligase
VTISPVPYLRCFVFVLFLIPAYYIIPGAGSVGSIPTMFGVIALVWWLLARLVFGNTQTAEPNPVRWALLCYIAVVLASWTMGKHRVLTPVESTQSDRTLIATLGVVGIALVALDGLRTREQIAGMARTVAAASMIMVGAGVAEFYLGFDFAGSIRPPGLILNYSATGLDVRSIFTRARGTAMHPIEFGVVAAGLVPLAYWSRRTRPGGLRWILPLAGLGFAAMISLSRSAMLVMVAAGAVLMLAVPWRQRLAFLLVAGTFVVVAGVVVGGLVGTLRALVTQSEGDPSVIARQKRFPLVMELVSENPLFGRGYGTFTIDDGFLLDNQIHALMITMGLVGVAALVLFIGFVVAVAWRTRQGARPEQSIAGAALAATIVGLMVSTYTFDTFFYQILTNLLYLSIGMVGALWRVTSVETAASPAAVTTAADYRLTAAG